MSCLNFIFRFFLFLGCLILHWFAGQRVAADFSISATQLFWLYFFVVRPNRGRVQDGVWRGEPDGPSRKRFFAGACWGDGRPVASAGGAVEAHHDRSSRTTGTSKRT